MNWAGKPYEFANKLGLLVHVSRKIVLAIESFPGNPHDSKTIAPLLSQYDQTGQPSIEEVIYDRGGRGKKTIHGVKITTPGKPKKSDSESKKRCMRRRFRRRAGIEAIISHLKSAHRMAENYLHGHELEESNL